jgi:hypothetical protein
MKFKLVEKLICLLLIVGLNSFGVFGVFRSFAFFEDTEEAQKSSVGASLLNFSIESDNNFSPKVKPSQSSLREFELVNDKDLEIDYDILIVVNNTGLCKELKLKVKRNDIVIYNGVLADFGLFGLNLPATDTDNFSSIVSLTNSDESFWGKECKFDLIFSGEQIDGKGFSDVEVLENSVVSGVWDCDDDPEVPDVVINEIMWMGSKNDEGTNHIEDEWIELRNMTDYDINIGKWEIENAKKSNKRYMVPASRVLPANGYFLISNHPEQSANSDLNVTVDQPNGSMNFDDVYSDNGQLILKDDNGNVVDVTPIPKNSDWTRGENLSDRKWSMERNLIPGDGSLVDSWHTCDPNIMIPSDLAMMHSYWKVDAWLYNCGTPRHANLSKNDPTATDYDEFSPARASSGVANESDDRNSDKDDEDEDEDEDRDKEKDENENKESDSGDGLEDDDENNNEDSDEDNNDSKKDEEDGKLLGNSEENEENEESEDEEGDSEESDSTDDAKSQDGDNPDHNEEGESGSGSEEENTGGDDEANGASSENDNTEEGGSDEEDADDDNNDDEEDVSCPDFAQEDAEETSDNKDEENGGDSDDDVGVASSEEEGDSDDNEEEKDDDNEEEKDDDNDGDSDNEETENINQEE